MKIPEIINLATRKSPLALVQAELVRQKLLATFPEITINIVAMNTSGDANVNVSLAEIGGKGLFTKELEAGLLERSIDIAVHSLKDMETSLPSGLIIAAVLEREDERDAIIAPEAKTIMNLKKNANIGTSSVRRVAQLKIMRPDLNITPLRGNINTRIAKLGNGLDGIMLAFAGLKRLGIEGNATEILDKREFIPAVGQGIIAIECKEDNEIIRNILAVINHEPSFIAAKAERAMLARLDGSCRTPIAGNAICERGF
ncbi:MAG: hydroxymethylbilane synthase, partial [Pseudomonadota bacterium]